MPGGMLSQRLPLPDVQPAAQTAAATLPSGSCTSPNMCQYGNQTAWFTYTDGTGMHIDRTRTAAANATLISASILASGIFAATPAYADPVEANREHHVCGAVEVCLYLTQEDFDQDIPAVTITGKPDHSVTLKTRKFAMIREGHTWSEDWYVGLSKKGQDGNCTWASVLSGNKMSDPNIDSVGEINLVGLSRFKGDRQKKGGPAPCP